MLLKRLAPQLPPDLAELIPTFEHYDIKTTENIIFTPRQMLYDLLIQPKTNPNDPILEISLLPIHEEDIDDLVEFCLDLTASHGESGDIVWARERERLKQSRWRGFGVGGLDRLFSHRVDEGAWRGVGVVEIAGQKRVGKSLLALHLALRVLLDDSSVSCRWIDTEGSFSPSRAQAVLEAWDVSSEKTSNVLDRLIISPCFRLEPDLVDVLASLRTELEANSEDPGVADGDLLKNDQVQPRILVIDPITNLFKDLLMNTSAQGHASMVAIMEEIAELTYSHNLLTIITNATASSVPSNPLSQFSTTTHKPALGTSFTYFSDISLLVQETGKVFGMTDEVERERTRSGPGLRGLVEVLKSRVSPSGRWAVFETDGTKLLDVLPPPIEDRRTLLMSAGLPVDGQRPSHGPLAVTLATDAAGRPRS